MHILVIGQTGQLAQSLQAIAPKSGVTVSAVGRPGVDLADPQSLEALFENNKRLNNPNVVVNAAAYTAVDLAETHPDEAFSVNRDGPGILARLCTGHDVPLIHLSTDYVFDGSNNEPYRESDKTHPLGVYGQSKLEGEQAVRTANPHHIILRTAWLISPYGQNFVTTMLRLMVEKDQLGIVDDQQGCPTSAVDLANAIIKISQRLTDNWGTYHLVGSGTTSWYGLACEIQIKAREIWGAGWPGGNCVVKPITTREYPTPAARPANSVLSTRAFQDQFGFALPNWQESLVDILHLIKQREG